MSYKLIPLLCSIFFLTSCFGGGGGTSEQLSTKSIQEATYTMNMFSSWEKVPESELPQTLSSSQYTVYQSPLPRDGIFSKCIIVYEMLPSPSDSMTYAKNQIISTPKIAIDYVKISENEINVGKIKTLLHVYTARNSTLAPELLFIQTAIVLNKTDAYTLTFTVASSAKDTPSLIQTYVSLLQSFVAR